MQINFSNTLLIFQFLFFRNFQVQGGTLKTGRNKSCILWRFSTRFPALLLAPVRRIRISSRKNKEVKKRRITEAQNDTCIVLHWKGTDLGTWSRILSWILMSLLINSHARTCRYFKTCGRNARTATTGFQVQCQCPRRGVARRRIYDCNFSLGTSLYKDAVTQDASSV